MYFWVPLLAGLSELTFDPRPEIRCVVLLGIGVPLLVLSQLAGGDPCCRLPFPQIVNRHGPYRPLLPCTSFCPFRYSALEVLFDILKFHGASFSPQFWLRVFDSVLLPIFDHVRAEVRGRGRVGLWMGTVCAVTNCPSFAPTAAFHLN